MNPAKPLQQMGKGYRAKVFFSATLSPLPYYQDILGGKEDDYFLSIPTPFSNEQVEVFIKPLSTRYRDREHTKDAIVSLVQSLLRKRPGHYLIFFPSYQYLLTVYDLFKQGDDETKTLIQTTGMTEVKEKPFWVHLSQIKVKHYWVLLSSAESFRRYRFNRRPFKWSSCCWCWITAALF